MIYLSAEYAHDELKSNLQEIALVKQEIKFWRDDYNRFHKEKNHDRADQCYQIQSLLKSLMSTLELRNDELRAQISRTSADKTLAAGS